MLASDTTCATSNQYKKCSFRRQSKKSMSELAKMKRSCQKCLMWDIIKNWSKTVYSLILLALNNSLYCHPQQPYSHHRQTGSVLRRLIVVFKKRSPIDKQTNLHIIIVYYVRCTRCSRKIMTISFEKRRRPNTTTNGYHYIGFYSSAVCMCMCVTMWKFSRNFI